MASARVVVCCYPVLRRLSVCLSVCPQVAMPGPCERLRLPSVGSSDPNNSSLQKEQHKVVVMGAARVGKSSIIAQFLYDK